MTKLCCTGQRHSVRRLARLLPALSVAAVILAAGCTFEDVSVPPPATAAAQQSIVGGSNTSGFPAVGALVIDFNDAWGHFCSGTLIASEWVLTAAHCFAGEDGEDPLEPYQVSFFNGPSDANPGNGTTIEIDSFHPHPLFESNTDANDIALAHLADPATGITPIPLLSTVPDTDDPITWVGYGSNNGIAETGSGVKRTGVGEIDDLFGSIMVWGSDGVLPCSGDSGGATLMTVSGTQRVAAVIVTADEDCTDGGSGTRVDYFHNWIEDTMAGGGGFENCDLLGGDCTSGACFPVDDGVRDCVPSENAGLGDACDPDPENWGDALPCDDGLICLTGETEGTGQCYAYCDDDAACAEEEGCFKPLFEDADLADIGVCVPEAPDCELTAHECPDGLACYPVEEGGGGCFTSDGAALGGECDPNATDTLPCDDGLLCLPITEDESEGLCFSFCMGDGDCDTDDVCYAPIFTDLEDVGVCLCRDDDEDLWCSSADCDDTDADINPDASEVCGDTVDNNCNDQTDEGCDCTDSDGDGFCPPADCDDVDGARHPDAAEACGDAIDNDCDSQTDEAEACDCEDTDNDGYCPPADCDNSTPLLSPARVDDCGDGIDNNCSGAIDETCGTPCTDGDGDGFCPEDADCNDADPGLHPEAAEICDDNVDNDCDGAFDGEDDQCNENASGGDGSDNASGDDGAEGCSVGAQPAPLGVLPLTLLVALALALPRLRRR